MNVDTWVTDTEENLKRLNRALRARGAAWGPTEIAWAEAQFPPHQRRNRPRQPAWLTDTEARDATT